MIKILVDQSKNYLLDFSKKKKKKKSKKILKRCSHQNLTPFHCVKLGIKLGASYC